ncbi:MULTISPECIES: zinc ribbon domain-containing protein [unclassified Mesorhizobium]|uniref:zinc ribbon domain-containing protein n=1 Tax=unclassified Mesorhizobium TaxID=325217 RepID=UPI00112C0F0C|nr:MULTISPECIES: zinc ribbon domain-containing protein [unclassified Mesorhizobium]TPK96976.1 zinc ribbon domain-containing protein [Mesorhizobium sp. B2-4-16]TPL64995.1 zinc ribbon domain-containing protein [Mesorhizobium sp. B2-4-3]
MSEAAVGNDQEFDEVLDDSFEERADHVEEAVIKSGTATGDQFDEVVKHLCAKGLVLLVGPRGCGKTHLMRYAWLECLEDSSRPFCVYTSLNRYLSLEPWSRTRSDAHSLFHSWILARILFAAYETFNRITGDQQLDNGQELVADPEQLEKLIKNLERNFELDSEDEELHRKLSVQAVQGALIGLARRSRRKRAVLLLDDAALTLTPAFMTEFLDILRVVKSPEIAPKCSIYPGTTVFGTRFHADHEGRTISAWAAVGDPAYRSMMQTIAERRYREGLESVTPEANTLLQYAAFGIPRAYLTLLRSVHAAKPTKTGLAAIVTKAIRAHRDNRIREFQSLGEKVVELKTLIRVGERFFDGVVTAMTARNEELKGKNVKSTTFGIDADDFEPLTTRMVDLLAEAGLLYREEDVSHGRDRQYRRFTPHLAALIAARAFSAGERGTSLGSIVDFIDRPNEKHPVRRKFKTIFAEQGVDENLKLDLPPCQACQTPRDNAKQKFCQNCGNKLVDELIYTRIMAMEINGVPGLTDFLISKMESANIRTVGDLRSFRDPGTELRKIPNIAKARSDRILGRVEAYVDEMMS